MADKRIHTIAYTPVIRQYELIHANCFGELT
jgi:hypothetical protein